ncbi:calcium-translocating P-type ATPase, SERCA-type [Cohnella sp. CIP 111063]|uniref:calcium-translocating P-type ATPase, SERCA-type n=1 Tax=unclassified Cohnella TaxID=2636738 RepID=UPI000B8BEF95|nr:MULTISPECIES: calcium-translocating P-type ATPase, SERCA-type [unclassified Cohnella]OXS62328.1 calcium-translocating P-type ATPase, SERCA-type [Cohnella sp. CIP 111063]
MEGQAWHQLSEEQLTKALDTDGEKGLSREQADERLQAIGPNELAEKRGDSPLKLLLNQFKDFMVLVLVGATIISGLLGEMLDALTIIAIILINGVLGFYQEYRAERSLRALKELSAPFAKVIRGGELLHIPARDLVSGDLVLLESGDRVPADLRFVECNDCSVDESALTGESVPVVKSAGKLDSADLALGDRKNCGYLGTMVTRGTAKGIVTVTGMRTEMGKIADLIQQTEEAETPLQHRLEQLGKILIVVALVLTVVVVLAGILHGQPAYDMFLAGVSLAVAAIPEGLPAIVTIALALGVQRMIKRRAIVRKLPSVETLGCASVICSDKTGTLTQNKMTVTKLWLGGRTIEVTGEGYEPVGLLKENGKSIDAKGDAALRRLTQIAALCNNSDLSQQEKSDDAKKRKPAKGEPPVSDAAEWKIKGDPTEAALLVLSAKTGLVKSALQSLYTRVKEFPFDAERKRMSVLVSHQGGKLICAKGAPDLLVGQCAYVLWDDQVVPFTASLKSKVLAANEAMARESLRVLGTAYRDVKGHETCDNSEQAESGLIFVGLTGMMDPPRKEVKEAIYKCRQAGIKTVMITGDHGTTAESIARTLGIIGREGRVITGTELAAMPDEELEKVADDVNVYARVSPEHKLRIVQALQRRGHVVAMTGDGVNDAPAVKAADIGIAMGITGTDVTKEASALVLSDDNFSSIVAAVEEGRGIYENIRKFIRYLLASNVGEIMTMFLAMMAGLPLPLVPIQILWVNLVTDGLPAMALGVDQAESDLMQQKPRPAKENIFARRLGWKIVSRGVLIGLCTLGAFVLALKAGEGQPDQLIHAQTVAFATLVMAQLIHVFDCRSSRSIFHRKLLENKFLVLAVLSSLVLMLAVLYIEPLQPIFKTVPLDLRDWALVIVAAGIPTFAMGAGSVWGSSKQKKKGTKITYGGNSASARPAR